MQLNFFPINIEFDKYQIFKEPYTEKRLAELRKLYNSTHSFFRNEEYIFVSNKDGDENTSLGTLTEKSTYDNHEVTASLIKHLFFRTFKDRFPSYTPVDFYPFRFFSGQSKDDIIFNSLPTNLQNKVAYKKLIEVQLRLTEINSKKQYGFIISIKRNWIFEKSCADLHSEGYNLKGIEVLHSEALPGLQNILTPNEEFIGVLQEVNGTKAKVETNEGVLEYELEELFIKKTKFNIGNYLTFATSQQKSDAILNIIESKRSEIYNAKNLYNEIQNISKHLFMEDNGQSVLFQNKDSFCFTVDSKPLTVINTLELKTPTFIFDYAATKTNNINPDVGLTNYGPYDSINFDIKSPHVLCICNRVNRGYFSNFLSSLKHGIPDSAYFKKGLVKKYDLQEVLFDIKEIQSNNIDEYLNVIKNYDENRPHLAIIEIPASFKKYDDKSNPYYKIKAKLLSLQIPVQYITSEKIKNYNEYLLNSIALQIYAKLGGTP